tara:strand:+ start:1904 stop:3352 length:1449 start_codon:yes stop_codon:yes gene_type:complete
MIFNSIDFHLFFLVFFILFWIVPKEKGIIKNVVLLAGSYFFYCWWDWRFALLLLGSSLVSYLLGLGISKADKESTKSYLLYLGIFSGILSLFFFKYYNFFLLSFQDFIAVLGFNVDVKILKLILPLGISFYSFRILSYIIDVYKNKIEPTKSCLVYFNYVSFFPSLISGPIDRSNLLTPQLEKPAEFKGIDFAQGCRQILWGFFKKVVIADNLMYFSNYAFENYQEATASTLVIGAVLYAIQLYADFSGYSDMAIGYARLLGFKITRNFAYPFFAENITEYWRRWHISLTSWTTEYVFTPITIALRDYGKWGLWLAVFFNFLAVGLWHGANWTFVFFGVLNALLYIPFVLKGKLTSKRQKIFPLMPTLKQLYSMAITFTLVVITDVFFRSDSVPQALVFFKNIMDKSLFSLPNFDVGNIAKASLIFIPVLFITEWVNRDKEFGLEISYISNQSLRFFMYITIISMIIFFGAFGNDTFIYFQF